MLRHLARKWLPHLRSQVEGTKTRLAEWFGRCEIYDHPKRPMHYLWYGGQSLRIERRQNETVAKAHVYW